jgi:hypothetical protein
MVIYPLYPTIRYPTFTTFAFGDTGSIDVGGENWGIDHGLAGGTTGTVQFDSYPLSTYGYEITTNDLGDYSYPADRYYEERMQMIGNLYTQQLNQIILEGGIPFYQGIINGLNQDLKGIRFTYSAVESIPQVSRANIAVLNQGMEEDCLAEAARCRTAAKVKAVAVSKGERLLEDILGSDEYAKFMGNGFIDIPSKKTPDMMYRVRKGRRIGIVKLEKDIWVETTLSLCIHPESHWRYVEGDQVAAHILLCKFDEVTLERVANKHQLRAA